MKAERGRGQGRRRIPADPRGLAHIADRVIVVVVGATRGQSGRREAARADALLDRMRIPVRGVALVA